MKNHGFAPSWARIHHQPPESGLFDPYHRTPFPMKFQDLKPGELFTFKPHFGGPWNDANLYRKATETTYHRADKVLMIRALADLSAGVAPESADAIQPLFRPASEPAFA